MNNGHIQPLVCLGPNQVLSMVTKNEYHDSASNVAKKNYIFVFILLYAIMLYHVLLSQHTSQGLSTRYAILGLDTNHFYRIIQADHPVVRK